MKKNISNTTTAKLNNNTRRYVNVLRTLIAAQEDVLAFLDKKGLLDSKEGDALADTMGDAIKSFSGIIGDDLYHKVVNGTQSI